MFNFAVVYGDPLRRLAEWAGARPVNTNNAVWCVSLMSGFIVNSAYCGYLLTRNRNCSLFTTRHSVHNWILSILMGGTWMGGVAIHGMAVSKPGRFGASIGWALIQSTAIMAGNAKGLITGEWRNTSNQFRRRMIAGLLTLFGGIATVALSALV
jgi:L-rhamnose-H+ transport protein